MPREIIEGDIEVAQNLLSAQRDPAQITAALVYRGLDEQAATRLVEDLKKGRRVTVQPPAIPNIRHDSPPRQHSSVEAAPARRSGLAMASLVLGLLGFFGFGVFAFIGLILGTDSAGRVPLNLAADMTGRAMLGAPFGIIGLILGFVSMGKIKKSGGLLTGRGIALAGTIVSGFCLLVPVLIPNLVRAAPTARALACINNMIQIDGAIQQWAVENKKQDSDSPDAVALVRYIHGGVMPTCPAGGVYVLAPTVGTIPRVTCPNASSKPPHVLETGFEPRVNNRPTGRLRWDKRD